MAFLARAFRCLILMVGLAAWGGTAHAACSSPSGDAGAIIYSATYNMPAYCDGTNWVAMGGSTGGASALSGLSDVSVAGATTGSILSYNGSNWVVSSTAAVGAALASLTDVTLTNLSGRDYLRYDSVSTKWVNISESTVMSTTTMVANFPDAITCVNSGGTSLILYAMGDYNGTDKYYGTTIFANGDQSWIRFNSSSGAYSAQYGAATFDCSTGAMSISQLYASGRAFNFIGNATTSGGAHGDRITSGTLAMVANSATSYISLSTNGTDWGYLGSGASFLPAISGLLP